VQRERGLDRGRGVLVGRLAGREALRRGARRSEREQQPLDLGAAGAALADDREVEDLARQVREVHGARQTAELGDAQAGVVVPLPRHEPYGKVGLAEQLGNQVGILPIEVDQHDPALGLGLGQRFERSHDQASAEGPSQ